MKKNIFKKFIIALAPMAGVTDFAFRKICADYGANMTVTEMISAKAFEHNSKKTYEMLREEKHSAIKCVQLFGHDPKSLETIIKSGALEKFDVIDFNCGCPAPKIVGNKEGSYLMQDIDTAKKCIEAIRRSTTKPISVKFRLGINGNQNYLQFGKMCEECGVDFVTLHARTREQQYAGDVDKSAYEKLVQELNIPVVWSGNILTKEDLKYAKKIGCKGVMIARGALGYPEIFSSLTGKKRPYTKRKTILTHINLMKDHLKNDKITHNYFKKHLAWYCKNIDNTAELRRRAVSVTSIDDIYSIVNELPEDF